MFALCDKLISNNPFFHQITNSDRQAVNINFNIHSKDLQYSTLDWGFFWTLDDRVDRVPLKSFSM